MHRQLEDIFHHFSVVRNGKRIIPHGRIKWLYEQAEKAMELEKRVEELEDKLYELNESAYQTQIDFLETNGKKNKLLEENQQLQEFYDYFANLHGKGLEVANYHLNDTTEPFDNFFDEADKALKGETK